jgi:hypothetical protein
VCEDIIGVTADFATVIGFNRSAVSVLFPLTNSETHHPNVSKGSSADTTTENACPAVMGFRNEVAVGPKSDSQRPVIAGRHVLLVHRLPAPPFPRRLLPSPSSRIRVRDVSGSRQSWDVAHHWGSHRHRLVLPVDYVPVSCESEKKTFADNGELNPIGPRGEAAHLT